MISKWQLPSLQTTVGLVGERGEEGCWEHLEALGEKA
jgi:hypothetical protein